MTLLSFLQQFAYYMYSISQSRWRILERIYKDSFQDGIRVILKVDAFFGNAVKRTDASTKKNHYPTWKAVFLLFMFTLLPLLEVRAQQENLLAQSDDLLIIEEDDESWLQYFSDYWDKHFIAGLNASYTTDFDNRNIRIYASARLGWKEEWKWISINTEALLHHRNYKYRVGIETTEDERLEEQVAMVREQCSRLRVGADCATEASQENVENDRVRLERQLENLLQEIETNEDRDEFKLDVADTNILPIEANIALRIGDTLQLLAGYHTIVWGQLDFLSPVDFLLPSRTSSGGFSLIKAENRNPQLVTLLSFFPLPWIELQGYFFPLLDLDSALIDSITESADANREGDYRNVAKFKMPEGKDAFHYAGRLLFYWGAFTLGFTYYHGFFQFGSEEKGKLTVDTTQTDAEGESVTLYGLEANPTFSKFHAYGLETSYALGRWVMKFEASYLSLDVDTYFDSEGVNLQTLGELPIDEGYNDWQNYIQWVIEKNNNNLWIKEHFMLLALGVDANLDSWLLNLGVVVFITERSDNASRRSRPSYKGIRHCCWRHVFWLGCVSCTCYQRFLLY